MAVVVRIAGIITEIIPIDRLYIMDALTPVFFTSGRKRLKIAPSIEYAFEASPEISAARIPKDAHTP